MSVSFLFIWLVGWSVVLCGGLWDFSSPTRPGMEPGTPSVRTASPNQGTALEVLTETQVCLPSEEEQ